MNTDKLYLVTGGTGFIGAALVRRMVNEGRRVRVMDNDLRGSAARLSDIRDRFELVVGDVRDTQQATEAARGVDCILHLAALNGTENFYQRPELVLDVGVRGMYGMLEAARANGIKDFVLASSSEAYQTPAKVPTSEDEELKIPDPWNPRYSYGGSKLISEIMLANYNRDLFERAVIFRPHNVYGPDMGFEHVLPQFILRAHEQVRKTPEGPVPFRIQGDGTDTRSFVYIDDFLDGLLTIVDKGAHRQIYHIGTEAELSVRELAERVVRWFGRDAAIEAGEPAAGGTKRRCPDITKLRALGYDPTTPLDDGIARTAEWYVAHAERTQAAG